jgi:tRNA(Ile)-lysidine synthase
MIDEKIPKEKRNQIQLLADGHHILWIIGYRISEYYKVTAHTKYVLQVKKNGGESYV